MSFEDPYREVECTFCGQVLHGIDECRAHALKERYNLETYYGLEPELPDDEFLFQVGYGTVEQIREFIDGANQPRGGKEGCRVARGTLKSNMPALFEKDEAGALKYRSVTSAKAYARIRKMYQQALRDRKEHERKLKEMSK